MIPRPLSGVLRPVSTFAIILGILSTASSHAQTAQRTLYGICSYSLANVAYLSNTLSLPNNEAGPAGAAFRQYALQHAGALNARCSWSPTADTLNNSLKQLESRAGTPGAPAKFIDTGWTYQPGATATPAAALPAPAGAAQPYGARTATPVAATATPNAAQSTAAGTGKSATNAATGSVSNSVGSSMGSAITGAGTSAKQSVESSATNAVNSSASSAATSASQMVNDGMSNLQNRLFHKKSAQPAGAPAGTAAPTTAATATAVPPVSATAAAAPAAALPAAEAKPATAPAAADKPSIQEEGDGKHSILTLPGDSDAHELTLVSGSKNVYLEESTGDKYIVMPNGLISHIPHKNAAK